ncbi:protein Erp6p [[Candida] railenensis]|uniref:Protein Erp6p n=1 Tax=[Candida] railenensis TaxID=45579 RepID=A0A9P0VYP2_9ASCO|nr:protein Erp6p [[Candida] railenensis]
MKWFSILSIIAISIHVQFIWGQIHFYTPAGTKTCFNRELVSNTLLIGKFKMDILEPSSGQYVRPVDTENTGMLIDVEEKFGGNHKVVHQRASNSGQFTFSALDSGDHSICFTPKSFIKPKKKLLDKIWNGDRANSEDTSEKSDPKFTKVRLSVHFEIRDGSFIDSRSAGKVESLVQQVNSLNDKLIDIRREQIFIREKEWNFRDQSERTCDTVVKFLIIQGIATLITFLYQIVSYRKLFKKEKEKKD